MPKSSTFIGCLLLTTALCAPVMAQTASPSAPATADSSSDVDISTTGGGLDAADIVVTGRNIPNSIRATSEVISVLSTEDIARTGAGDIAGALQRVTGLSVVGNGFVYVRGLGDRYSLALLNGSPLPSPEPLRRVVPLDIFPTSVLASTVVQKSYSANYPGEFGGGVINLTTKAIPDEGYFTFGMGGSVDTETTGKLGYLYYGSPTDWTGIDSGRRKLPKALGTALTDGTFNSLNSAARQGFAASLLNASTTLLQRTGDTPGNWSANIGAGTAFDTSFGRMGLIASAGYDNNWRTRGALQQTSLDPNLSLLQTSFRNVITDNRLMLNGMVGVGAEIGQHRIRWTNLLIRDTLKQARLASGYNLSVVDPEPGLPDTVLQQRTSWTERQLFDTQMVGEFKFDRLSLDLRGTYANSKRKSPYERSFTYVYDQRVSDYVNPLSGGGSASVAFSDLNENLYAGSGDLSYKFDDMPLTLSAGYAYTDQKRTSSRYQLDYFSPTGALPLMVAQQRPDYLVSDYNIYTYGIELRNSSAAQGAAAYDAGLRIHAGYAQLEAEVAAGLRVNAGARYEDAVETVQPLGDGLASTRLKAGHWLPSATITWNFADDMQLRLAGSKTIARPQFRELARQIFFDFESDRQFVGNPFLTDSKLWNAEARYEWYFDRDQRVSLAGFYKRIDNPIEPVLTIAGGATPRTGFANAPAADLYGAELELQKYFPLDTLTSSAAFSTRRAVLIANYTYTQSKLKVGSQTVIDPNLNEVAANLLFQDGARLTGQSDHLVNLQIGLEDTESLSQQTLMLTYASDRITNRGPLDSNARQPDLIERPGVRLDFIVRQGVQVGPAEVEVKLEARNLLGTPYREFQERGDRRVYINRYDLGRVFSISVGTTF